MSIRSGKKSSGDIYLQDVIGTDKEGNEVRVEDKIADLCDSVDDQVDLKIQINRMYAILKSVLRGREKIVIELRYGLQNNEEMTQREIASQLDISRSYVSRIEKKALSKLGKELDPNF